MTWISIPALLLLGVSLFAADTVPHFKSAAMPFYPPLARQARIEGKVTLRFTVKRERRDSRYRGNFWPQTPAGSGDRESPKLEILASELCLPAQGRGDPRLQVIQGIGSRGPADCHRSMVRAENGRDYGRDRELRPAVATLNGRRETQKTAPTKIDKWLPHPSRFSKGGYDAARSNRCFLQRTPFTSSLNSKSF